MTIDRPSLVEILVSDETPPNLYNDEILIQNLTKELQEKIEEISKMNM
jgi:hypothetical protein